MPPPWRGLPDLRLIAMAATGTGWIDKACCQTHGIAISNIYNCRLLHAELLPSKVITLFPPTCLHLKSCLFVTAKWTPLLKNHP